MVTAQFYTMYKRDNSTLQPSAVTSPINVTLKEGCSLLHPSITVAWPDSGTRTSNYCFLSFPFNRYYWVDDWTYEAGLWRADMHVDVLASFKPYIGMAQKYVLRSASASNPDAIDTEYPATAEITKTYSIGNAFNNWGYYGSAAESGTFVLTCVGDNQSETRTGVVQFQVSADVVQKCIKNAFSAVENFVTTSPDELISVCKMLTRGFSDIGKFLTSVRWFPCTFSVQSTAERIHLSLYELTIGTYHAISDPLATNTCDIQLSQWPAAGTEKWEWLEPYATYTLDAQPWGVINLDANDVVNGNFLRLVARTDSLSGLSLLEVYLYEDNDYPRLIASRTAQIGIDVPYGGSGINAGAAVGGLVQVAATAAAAYSGNAGAGELVASIGSAAAATTAQGYASGTSGGGAAIKSTISLYCRKLGHVATNVAERGKPLCETRRLDTLSGFIQCKDSEIEVVGATAAELSQIGAYLTGGFYYE